MPFSRLLSTNCQSLFLKLLFMRRYLWVNKRYFWLCASNSICINFFYFNFGFINKNTVLYINKLCTIYVLSSSRGPIIWYNEVVFVVLAYGLLLCCMLAAIHHCVIWYYWIINLAITIELLINNMLFNPFNNNSMYICFWILSSW